MNKNRKTLKMPVRYLMNAVLVVLLFLALSYMTGNMLSTYQNKVLMTVGINIILAVSLNVATGYLGQLPLGHAGFMAVGAYTCALFTKYSPLPDGVSFAIGLALGAVMAGLFGVLIGVPALRLTGDYLAILTLGFGEIIRITLNNIDDVLGYSLFYGSKGLKNIPKYSNFANVFLCVVITCFLIHAMMKSRHGRAVLAIRDNEIAAESCGIQTTYYKVMAFMVENEISKIDARVAARMEADGQMGQARIIPRYDSVKDNPDLLPAENIKEILRSRRKITQNQCACRIRYPEIPSDPYICLSFDLVADAAEAREIGTVIPWEQAFDYIQASGKKYPVCHVNKHTDKLDEIGGVMCSCTADACVLLKNAVQLESAFKPWKYYGKSRFRAVVDPQKCVNCGLCRNKRCMFDAIDVRYNKTTKDERHFVMEENCMGCGCCAETCPKGAITMKCVEPPEYLLGKVLPDNRFQEDESNLRPGQLGADVYNNSDI